MWPGNHAAGCLLIAAGPLAAAGDGVRPMAGLGARNTAVLAGAGAGAGAPIG
jgi:hypothetical protein